MKKVLKGGSGHRKGVGAGHAKGGSGQGYAPGHVTEEYVDDRKPNYGGAEGN